MIVRMGLIRRRGDVATPEFRRHWRDAHGPIAARLPGLRRYHQNHVVDRSQRAIAHKRGNADYDGFSQLWFDDLPSMRAAVASEPMRDLAADEGAFIGEVSVVTALPHVVVPKVEGVPLIKRMSTLKRRPDVSPERFQTEWFDVHSHLVRRLDGVAGYTQNLVLDRSHGRARPASHDEMPIDGIVELWFRDAATLNAAFGSDAGRTLMTHAAEFIDEISTFLVETHEVV